MTKLSIENESEEKETEKRAEEETKKAAEKALIHHHAFQFVLASFHQGTPRVKAWTALRLAASIATIANSQALDRFRDQAANQPSEALEAVTQDVRKDEEQRQKDQVAVTTQENAVIDASLQGIK